MALNSHLHELNKALTILFDKQGGAGLLLPFVRETRQRGGTLWLCGNGGSYANALHWACDLSKMCKVRAQMLGANGSLLTAWANDEEYEHAFANELHRYARPDDALIALSCSGLSSNIWRALVHARTTKRLPTALVTGTVNQDVAPADTIVRVWSKDYAVIEDCHAILGHWLTKELAQ